METFESKLNLSKKILENILKMLSPIIPHVTQQLWTDLGHSNMIINEEWPKVDIDALKEAKKEIIVQINGKLRGRVIVNTDDIESQVDKVVKNDKKINQYFTNKKILKIIFVKDKLINYVVQ